MMKVPRKHRISIDLDTKNQLKLLKTYYNMKMICNPVYVWRTNKGYHIYGRFPNRTIEQNMTVRRMLGDDSARLELDERRIDAGLEHLAETLFVFGKEKIDPKTNRMVKSVEEPHDITKEQFWGFRNATT